MGELYRSFSTTFNRSVQIEARAYHQSADTGAVLLREMDASRGTGDLRLSVGNETQWDCPLRLSSSVQGGPVGGRYRHGHPTASNRSPDSSGGSRSRRRGRGGSGSPRSATGSAVRPHHAHVARPPRLTLRSHVCGPPTGERRQAVVDLGEDVSR